MNLPTVTIHWGDLIYSRKLRARDVALLLFLLGTTCGGC